MKKLFIILSIFIAILIGYIITFIGALLGMSLAIFVVIVFIIVKAREISKLNKTMMKNFLEKLTGVLGIASWIFLILGAIKENSWLVIIAIICFALSILFLVIDHCEKDKNFLNTY